MTLLILQSLYSGQGIRKEVILTPREETVSRKERKTDEDHAPHSVSFPYPGFCVAQLRTVVWLECVLLRVLIHSLGTPPGSEFLLRREIYSLGGEMNN